MDNGLTQNPSAKTIRCQDCGEERTNIPWTPGTPCPACQSLRFEPVVVISTVSDYDSADRSRGFALEDIRFGRLATWANMISPKQLQRALFQQSRHAQRGGSTTDLAGIFLTEKILDKRQVTAILAARCVEPGNTDDIEFGLTAVRLGLATEQQITSCRKTQREAIESGGDAPPLPLLLCEKRILKEGQVLALLKKAEMQGKGLLFILRRNAAKPRRSRRGQAGLFSQLAEYPVARLGAVALLALLVAIFLYTRISSSSTHTAAIRCEKCGAEGGAPVTSEWPLDCPQCHQKSMCPLGICLQCGARFIVKDPLGYGINCPRCGSSNFKMLTNNLNMGEIEAQIKTHTDKGTSGE